MPVYSIHSVLILRMECSGTKAVWSQQADAWPVTGRIVESAAATCRTTNNYYLLINCMI